MKQSKFGFGLADFEVDYFDMKTVRNPLWEYMSFESMFYFFFTEWVLANIH